VIIGVRTAHALGTSNFARAGSGLETQVMALDLAGYAWSAGPLFSSGKSSDSVRC